MNIAASAPTYDGLIGWVLNLMEQLGDVGVGVAVFLEQFIPPIPSEAILPGAGYLAWEGKMNFWGAWVAATIGAVLGALIWYAIGAALGPARTRRFINAVPLMDGRDYDRASAFFQKWGNTAILLGRCVPLVRSFISVPAGIERMRLWSFVIYTTVGSALWNGIWVGLGFAFGPAIQPVLEEWSGVLSTVVVVAVVAVVAVFVGVRLVRRFRQRATSPSELSS